ncbi:VCBS domain-containing protein, partial [Endozoicomonas sp.]|uniref:VCBS domain-containing protein n=1 Tax=Endozoicomonas sp. TaxID=1892382 RepID=UPI00383BCC45
MSPGSSEQIVGLLESTSTPIEVTDAQGNTRVVKPGDPVYLNETIQNNSNTEITIQLVNGQTLNLTNQQQIVMSPETLSNHEPPEAGDEKAQSEDSEDSSPSEQENSDTETEQSADENNAAKPASLGKLNEQPIIEREINEKQVDSQDIERSTPTRTITSTPSNTSSVVINLKPEILTQSFDIDENTQADGSISVGIVQANDPDSSNGLTYAIIAGNDDDKFDIDPNTGAITVTGDLNYELTAIYDLTVEVTDGGNLSDSAIITININDLNEAPEAISDNAAGHENETLTINVLANDVDEDFTDSPLNFSLDSANTIDINGLPITGQGSVSILNNQLTFNPGSDFDDLAVGETESVIVHYWMSDDEGLNAESTVTIIVTGTNDIPTIEVASDVNGTISELVDGVTGENTSTLSDTGSFSIADVDLSDVQTLSVTEGANNYRGTFTPVISDNTTGDGTGQVDWTFTIPDSEIDDLAAGQTLTQSYTVTVNDGNGGTVDQAVTITLTGTNDSAIITGDDSGTITEDVYPAYSTFGFSHSQDVGFTFRWDNATLTAPGISINMGTFDLPSGTSVDENASSLADFINENQDRFIAAVDGTLLTITAIDPMSDPVNGAFSLQTDSFDSTNSQFFSEDHILRNNGQLNITDIDSGEAIFASATITGDYGTLELSSDGGWVYEASATQPGIQNLGDGDSMTDTIEVQSIDGTTHNIVITINGTNDVAVIGGVDTGSVEEDASATLSVTGELTVADVDADEASFTPATITGEYGSLTIDQAGNWTYSADNTEPAVQGLPGGGDISFASAETTATNVAGWEVDNLLDGEKWSGFSKWWITSSEAEDNHSATLTLDGTQRVDTIDIAWLREDRKSDTIEIEYQNADGEWQSLGNFDPAGTLSQTITFDEVITEQLRFTPRGMSNNPGGSIIISEITASVNAASITDTIEVTALDGTTHNIDITITGTNDGPVASALTDQAATEDAQFSFPVPEGTFSDIDTGDVLTYSATLDDNSALPPWLSFDAATQTFSGIPGNDDVGSIALKVTATDGLGASASSLFNVTIANTNDAPTATVDTEAGDENETLIIDVLANDTDVDSDDSPANFSLDSVEVVDTNGDPVTGQGTVSIIDNQLQFVPGTDFDSLTAGDTATVTVRYVMADNEGATSEATVTITVTGTNDGAVITGTDTGALVEDDADALNAEGELIATGTLTISDTDTGEASFTADTVNGDYGSVTIAEDGNWSYSVDNSKAEIQALGGSDVDVIFSGITATYESASSGWASSNLIDGQNTGGWSIPSAEVGNHSVTLTLDGAQHVNTLDVTWYNSQAYKSDTLKLEYQDVNGQWQSLGEFESSMLLTNQTINFDLVIANQLRITPTGEATDNTFIFKEVSARLQPILIDTIQVTALDGTTHDIDITITGTNDGPVASAISWQDGTEDVQFSFTVPTNRFSDIDVGDVLTYNATLDDGSALPSWLSFEANSRIFSGIPGNDDVGNITLRVTATDTAGESATSDFTITVANVNDVPVAEVFTATVSEDDAVITEQLIATDADGDSITYAITQQPENAQDGTVTVDENGMFTLSGYDFNALDNGASKDVTFTYSADDGQGTGVGTNTVTLTITGTDDAPVVTGIFTDTVTEGDSAGDAVIASGTIAISDVDDSDSPVFVEVTGVAGDNGYGSLDLDSSGNWTYTLNASAAESLDADQVVTDTVTLTASDGTTQAIVLTITGSNDAPVVSEAVTLNA